jgi:Uma2 family endonuclease
MPSINLPPVETLDVDDLASLPRGYRYELHNGNLVIMTPSTYWHKWMARRLVDMFCAAGLEAVQDAAIRGDRSRDNRVSDVGVLAGTLVEVAEDVNLPGAAFRLIAEVVSRNLGEYTDRARWYAERGIPDYWIVDRTPERARDDASVHIHQLKLSDAAAPAYVRVRTVRLSELEAERRALTYDN